MEGSSANRVGSILDTPHQVTGSFAMESCAVRDCRKVFTDLLRILVILFEPEPLCFAGKPQKPLPTPRRLANYCSDWAPNRLYRTFYKYSEKLTW